MTIKEGKEVSWHDGSSCTNIILKKNGLSVESHNFSKPSFNPYLLTNLRRERGGLPVMHRNMKLMEIQSHKENSKAAAVVSKLTQKDFLARHQMQDYLSPS